jgi:diguanylate cyclase (GGDEF)-like protein
VTTELLIGASAVALIAAVAAIVIVTVVRARAAADERVAQAIRNLAAGMQDTMRDLTAAFERARAVAEPQEPAQELAASLDLEDVTKRTLQAAQAISGVDAAVLELDDVDGERTRAALGLEPDEARRVAVAAPPNESLRALEVVYRYGDEAAAAGEPVRSAIVLPVRTATGALGSLGAYSRSTPADAAGAVARLERIAHRAGPAVQNAQVFARARRMADTDALTGFNNHRFFHETLGREVARARRYERRIALVVFDLDDFKAINDRIGHLAGDAVLAEVAERVRTVMRSTDIAGRVGGDEFAVMLPEAGRADAELLAERIMRIVASRPIANAGTLYVSAGIAELRSDDTAREMFERADNALYAAKEAGKAQVRPANDA